MTAPPSSFGQWLKQLRAAADLTQYGLAERAGCTESLIRKYELGQRRPTRQTAESLARALRLPADEREAFCNMALFGTTLAPQPAAARHAVAAAPGWLPAPPTPLLGRKGDLATAARQLHTASGRMLTLLGPPGVGKTRMAIAVAADLRANFADGAWFVALAALSDPNLIVPSIARRLGLSEQGQTPSLDTLTQHLHQRQVLLLLDNFEHLLGAAELVAHLLEHCPGLYVLATSREPLRLRAEGRFEVVPLALPAAASASNPAAVAKAPATALFAERARAVQPSFKINQQNAAMLTRLCTRLAGLPLAIELAAARVDELPLPELLERLDAGLTRLGRGLRDLPARQQTLHATIAWSYGLLSPAEQHLFRHMGVFSGSFSLEAVAAVQSDPICNLQWSICNLTDKGLLQRQRASEGEERFALLEMLREFALEELAAHGELDEARAAHAAYFLKLAEQGSNVAATSQEVRWLQEIADDMNNVRAALTYLRDAADPRAALQMTIHLWRFWFQRGYMQEGRTWFSTTLECLDRATLPPDLHGKALYGEAFLASQLADGTAVLRMEQALDYFRVAGDQLRIARTLNALGMLARYPGNQERAFGLYNESLATFTQLQSTSDINVVRSQMAMLHYETGNYLKAERLFQAAIDSERAEGREHYVVRYLPGL
ncbi:MAG: helix-turn-helix domain-containing protein, partial [Chloroflexaceae bacterium]|nr:helix-turn-helix domain-containing protein [Chloroflexaceae bacterium]